MLLYFSVFDKEYDVLYLKRGIAAGVVLGVITLMLKRHKIAALILNIICILGVIFVNFEVIRESLIIIINFARVRASFGLEEDVYSVFLEISVFIFAAITAYTQNLRLSFIPQFLFFLGTTAYIVVMNKPFDTGFMVLYVIIVLCTAAYSLSSKNSLLLGFLSFAVFGFAAVFVVNSLNIYINEESYKQKRNESQYLESMDQISYVKKIFGNISVSALTDGQLLNYVLNGAIEQQLMFIITVSEFEDGFCLKSYTGESYTGMGWSEFSEDIKNSLPEKKPENIEKDIISADCNGKGLLFNENEVVYSLETAESVEKEFAPYFEIGKDSFYELSTEYLTVYDLTPERVSAALYEDMSEEDAESLIKREEKYRDFVYENYMSVPEGIRERLEENYGDLQETEYTSQLLNDLKERLNEDIEFNITAEAVTAGADPIEFTLDSKQADTNRLVSVGIMALRYLGYPARYAEGAFVSPDYKESAVKVGDNYKIDIYNLDAGAFAEIYIDGLGWLPVNFNPDNAREIVIAQIEAMNSIETIDISGELKSAAAPYVKSGVKFVLKAFAVICVLFVFVLAVRRYVLIMLRVLRIKTGKNETKKKAVYDYTEKAKIFFDKNIFEETEIYSSLNEYLYSPNSEENPEKIYKAARAEVKKELKKTNILKKFKAAAFKVVV
ncbi:MAG: transglutaminase domain-containing protein [Clostridiales bacterium]|nr:transglutaminase domain-containing protein [Clostridiales bacterium]